MLILALDAATAVCGAALARGEEVLAEYAERLPDRRHAARLLPLAQAALAAAGLHPRDLAAVAVTRGPGSYTGVRLGVATAKALAFALGIPAVGVSTLEALAYAAGPRPGVVSPLLDARRGRVYAALFRWEGEELLEVAAPRRVELGAWLAALGDGPVHFTGEGVRLLPAGAGGGATRAHALEAGLRPGAVAALAARRLAGGGGEDPRLLLPLYLGDPAGE